MLENLCQIPVTGVVPYMDVQIEDEDSLSRFLRIEKYGKRKAAYYHWSDPVSDEFPTLRILQYFPVFQEYG